MQCSKALDVGMLSRLHPRVFDEKYVSRPDEFCKPCNMLTNATQFRLARQNRIKVIVSGNAMTTGPGLGGVTSSRYYDRKYFLNVAKGLINRRERGYYLVPPCPLTAMRRLIGNAPQAMFSEGMKTGQVC